MKPYPWKTGVYLAPAQVLAANDLLRRLIDQVGVDHVILRTGFNVLQPDAELDQACDVLHRHSLGLCLLVGGWWGDGVDPGTQAMRPITNHLPIPTPQSAHESQWLMHCPLGSWSQEIARIACQWIRKYQPQAVCLTHARFHHAADLPGLFSIGCDLFAITMQNHGLNIHRLQAALTRFQARLAWEGASERVRSAMPGDIPSWMDQVADQDIFARWFALRCDIITQATQMIFTAIRQTIYEPTLLLGVNVLQPHGSVLSGQDYAKLAAVCDFLQPLLGYVRWHCLQPLAAWVDWLSIHTPKRGQPGLIHMLASLMGLPMLFQVPNWQRVMTGTDEGPPELLLPWMGLHHVRMNDSGVSRESLPVVLRGSDWSVANIRQVTRFWRQAGYPAVLYQGFSHLTGRACQEEGAK